MPEKKQEIRPLNGLRGIAALAVAMGHYHIAALTPLLSIFYWKNAAVDLFFGLSGFTLCLAYKAGGAKSIDFRNYLVARIARIYPLYFLTLVLSSFLVRLPVMPTVHERHVLIDQFIRQVLMINAWSVLGDGIHWNFPAWSVSIEFFCYLFLFPPLFLAAVWLAQRDWIVRLFGSILMAALSLYVYLAWYDQWIIIKGRAPDAGIPEVAYAVNLMRGVLGFTAGWIIYGCYLTRDRLFLWTTRNADLVSLGILLVLIGGLFGFWSTQLMLLGFPLLVLGVSAGNSRSARILSWGPIHYLGDISYSIYLLHMPWYYFGWLHAGLFGVLTTLSPASTAVLVGGLFVIAALSHRFVEMPARRLIRSSFQSGPRQTMRSAGAVHLAQLSVVSVILALFVLNGERIHLFKDVPRPLIQPGEETTSYPTFEQMADEGWGKRESWGIWSIGREASLSFRVANPSGPHLGLRMKAYFFVNDRHPAVTVRIAANGIAIGQLTGSPANGSIDATLPLPPDAYANGGAVRLTLSIDQPASPKSLGISEDTRVLGVGLTSMKLVDDDMLSKQ
jgi:peptidoglycan/LPS O-acetylase OafA/YrhL